MDYLKITILNKILSNVDMTKIIRDYQDYLSPKNERRCAVCNKVFPLTREFFYPYKNKKRSGLRGTCKMCYHTKWATRDGFCKRCGIRFYGIMGAKPAEDKRYCKECFSTLSK